MKYVKLFEQFIKEEAMKPNPDSKVVADDIKLENGEIISSAEIIGAVVNSETEKELEDFFYDKYGENAFKQGELANIKQLWNEYKAEQEEELQDKEKEEEGGDADDPLADL
jgi:RNA polymerase-interacting CarD/CdnL/TRCF family regulator